MISLANPLKPLTFRLTLTFDPGNGPLESKSRNEAKLFPLYKNLQLLSSQNYQPFNNDLIRAGNN